MVTKLSAAFLAVLIGFAFHVVWIVSLCALALGLGDVLGYTRSAEERAFGPNAAPSPRGREPLCQTDLGAGPTSHDG